MSLIYRQILQISISMVLVLAHVFCFADGTQDFNKLTLQTLASSAGISGPSSVYIASKNQYFVVYTDFDPTCITKQKLYGVFINAINGLQINPAFAITECGKKASSPFVTYNSKQNEFAVIYKVSDGGGTKIFVQTINAANNSLGQAIELANINLGDPYESLSIVYFAGKDRYIAAFHEVISTAIVNLKLNYINAINKSLLAYDTKIDKTTFPIPCEGVKHTRLLPLANKVFTTMEIQFVDGNEIWGAFFNPETGVLIGDYFQVSPSRETENYYINPSPALNTDSKEILVLYEKSHLQISTAALSKKINGQLIHPETGAKISPLNQVITTLPSGIDPEDVKWPQAVFSSLSNEFLVTFYGERWINANNNYYGIYLQRINADDLLAIGTPSTLMAEDAGDAIGNNNYLRPLSIAHNSLNNQYLLGWSNHKSNDVKLQIWRYDSNKPTNLAISTSSQNENLAIGTTFSTISAKDIDPEDATLAYSFASGTGGEDNSFFTISGNALKVAKKLDFEASATRKVRLKATDSHGISVEKAFVLTIKNVNEKPTSISLAGNLTVEENKPAGTFMSNITALDQDLGDTHNYTLVAGDSATNNANFSIEARKLQLNVPLNFEQTPKQLVRIRATDLAGLWVEKSFMISVLDVNERPESIEINKNELPENDAVSTINITVKDPDAISNYSYAFASGEGDSDNLSFSLQNNILKPAQPFDYEKQSNYSIRLKAFDSAYEIEQVFQISITNVNEEPEGITLSTNNIESDSPLGTLVCDMQTIDQDIDDSHIYTLIEGQNNFFINGAQLRIFKTLKYDELNPSNNLYVIRIKTTDIAGANFEKTFQIEVVLRIDDEKPVILNFDDTQVLISSEAAPFNLSINATDNEKLDTAYLYYRPIRSIDPFLDGTNLLSTKKIDAKSFQIDASLPGTLADEMGLSYYFKVRDAAGNVDSTSIAYAYTSYSQKVMDPTAKIFKGTADSYQIIANPFVLENSKLSNIFAQYPASGKDTWRLFKFENQQNKEIGQSTSELFAQGKGYWFNKSTELSSPVTFDKAFAPAFHDGNLYVMQLNKGWNLIGNPYPFSIAWEDVMLTNNLPSDSLPLYTFQRTYRESNVLSVFEGGFVFAEKAMSLSIPLHKTSLSNGRIAEKEKDENAWSVSLTLDNGNMKNTLAGIGMNQSAHDSFDKYDRPALPRFVDQPAITFKHPEHFSGAFSRDIVASKENHIWEFEASIIDEKYEITMQWQTDELKRTDKKLLLYNVSNNELVDMLMLYSYGIEAGQTTTFKVIYGDEAFVNESFEKLKIKVLMPYPNPFHQSVSFPIHLPSTSGSYQVECTVYDLLGEKVFINNEKKIAPGLYQLNWDENPGLCQGIYIYDIKVTSGYNSQTFHGRVIKY